MFLVLIHVAGPLAHIDGISRPSGAISPAPSNLQSSPSVPDPTLPSLTQQDKTKFLKLFIDCGPVNGLLSGEFMLSVLRFIGQNCVIQGEKARDVFLKSKLPYDKLSHIW